MGTVHSYTRVVGGKKQTVRRHTRESLPRRAWGNVKQAWRAMRRGKHGTALALGGLAVLQLGAWGTLNGTALTLTTLGIGAVAAGVAIKRATNGGAARPARTGRTWGQPQRFTTSKPRRQAAPRTEQRRLRDAYLRGVEQGPEHDHNDWLMAPERTDAEKSAFTRGVADDLSRRRPPESRPGQHD